MFGFYRKIAEFGRWTARIICCFFCFGPALTIVGIALLAASAGNTRDADVANFNTAVSNWTNSGRANFMGLSSGSYNIDNTLSLSLTSSAEPNPVESGAGISIYTPARYTASATSTAPITSRAIGGGTVNVFLSNFVAGTHTIAVPSGSQTIPVYFQSSISCSDSQSKCQSSCSGTFNSGTKACTYYFTLSEICYVVTAASGYNTVDNSGAGYGCALLPYSTIQNANGGGAPSIYRVSGLGPYGYKMSGSQPGSPVSFAGIPVTIRSDQDPWVVAARMTNGAMNFGLTKGQEIAGGIACLVIGIIFTIIPCAVVYALFKCCANRRKTADGSATNTVVIMSPGSTTMPQMTPTTPQQPPNNYQAAGYSSPPPPQGMQPQPQPQPQQPYPAPYGAYPQQPQPAPYGQPMPPQQPGYPAPYPGAYQQPAPGAGGYAPMPVPYGGGPAPVQYPPAPGVYPGAPGYPPPPGSYPGSPPPAPYPGAYPQPAPGAYPQQAPGAYPQPAPGGYPGAYPQQQPQPAYPGQQPIAPSDYNKY